ncbi:nucleotide exchange factor GrpE [Candidatus Poribacteria bacterium]|nr:MAG: nucleotide exchange factor GrpE [Candidatus Poribacteria bacterium]
MSEKNDSNVEQEPNENEEPTESISQEESDDTIKVEDTISEPTVESLLNEIESIQTQHKQQLEEVAESERIQYEEERDRLLRTVAEAENSKRRLEGESEKRLKFANENIIKGIIPVLDSLNAAIKSINEKVDKNDTESQLNTFSEGVELVHKQLMDVLKANGLVSIEALGEEFDPNIHESVFATESDVVPEGNIIEELRTGYKLHDRIIRASQVIISKGSPDIQSLDEETEVKNDESEE